MNLASPASLSQILLINQWFIPPGMDLLTEPQKYYIFPESILEVVDFPMGNSPLKIIDKPQIG